MAWNRTQDPESAPAVPRPTASGGGRTSTLGPSLSVKGDLTGSEDLRIEGSVDGTIRVDKHSIVVSERGRIKADIYGRSICVEGQVKGNLFGEEEIVIRPSGKLEGNITAPSVTLENGAKFRGAIDMEPKRPAQAPAESRDPKESRSESKAKSESSGLPANAAPAAAKG